MKTRLTLIDNKEIGKSRYAQLADALRNRIRRGEWTPGGLPLPSEQLLAQQHGVALGTMRRAIETLADEGLVERLHGRGTFVRAGLSGATMLRFFRFSTENGDVPHSRILSVRTCLASEDVMSKLGSAPGEEVVQIVRVRSFGDVPCLLETIWLPLPDFEPILSPGAARSGELLYPIYAELCGVHVHRAIDDISFAPLATAQARHLGLPPGHPSAVVHRRAFDLNGRCIEVRTTRGDAYAFHYTVSLN